MKKIEIASSLKLSFSFFLFAMSMNTVYAGISSPTPKVVGHMPLAYGVVIEPSPPRGGQTVTAIWGYTDRDGDQEGDSMIEWLLNGRVLYGETKKTLTLPLDSGDMLLSVRITPRSAAPADPAQGDVKTSSEIEVRTSFFHRYVKPDGIPRAWAEANAYCEALVPAARLPTRSELRNMLAESTNYKYSSDTTYEMCTAHDWPLRFMCGGSTENYYWSSTQDLSDSSGRQFAVNMTNGDMEHSAPTSMMYHVACILRKYM